MAESIRCATCGTEFEPSRSDTKYCGGACRQAALRDRSKSDAIARVGGISAPVTSFSTTSGAFGETGAATIELSGLRGDPQRDSIGRIAVSLSVGGTEIWAGDLRLIERACASGSISLMVAGPESRLAEQKWGATTWHGLSVSQFAAGAAKRAALPCLVAEQLDERPLGVVLGIEDGAYSAHDILLAAARETGCEYTVRNGALAFGSPSHTEPRTITASDARLTGYGALPEQVAVLVRSRSLQALGGATSPVIATGSVLDVPPGVAVYLITTFGRRQSDIDALAEVVGFELAAGVVSVEAETTDSVSRGDLVRVEAAGDLALRVTNVEHRFTVEDGLRTSLTALHLPALPTIPNALPRSLPAQIVMPWAA